MFNSIFVYELKSWLKKPTFYIYLLAFSGLAFVAFIGTAGFFDPVPKNASADYLNSPYGINYMLQFFNKTFLFLLPAIIGATIYKDYKNNTHSILYSFPIKKKDYLLGKFISALFIAVFIVIITGLAIMIAEHIPNLHIHKIGPFNLLGYLQSLLVITLPNMVFFGAIVFAIVTYTRNIYAGFRAIVLLFFLQNITENLFSNSGYLIALFDPFAQNTTDYITQNWMLNDRNTRSIPIEYILIYNRLLWLSIASIIFGYVYKTFGFTEHPKAMLGYKNFRKEVKTKEKAQFSQIDLSNITYNYALKHQLLQSWRLSNFDLKLITKSWMFYILVLFGLLAVVFSIGRVTNNEEMVILPVTHVILTIPAFFFTNIIMLLTFIYSGLLTHKAKTSNSHQLINTTPTTNWVFLSSKVLAVIKMQILLLFIMMIAGIIIKLYNGYTQFEIGHYLFDLFVIKLSGLVIWAFASISIHTIIKNTYLGIFALILLWLGIAALPQTGIDTRLLLFNFTEPLQYSDMNGYGYELFPYLLVKLYWFIFGLLLLILAYLFWNRGFLFSIKERLMAAKLQFKKPIKFALIIVIIGFSFLGFTIYKGERAKELSNKSQSKLFKAFEENFNKYASIELQPKITSVELSINLFPEENRFVIGGKYYLKNKTDKPIDTLLIKTGFDETTTFKLNKSNEVIDKDDYVHFYVLKLNETLQPKDSLQLTFNMKSKPTSLFENDSKVLKNGTFIRNNIFPRIGYFLNRAYKHPTDSITKWQNYYTQDADLVNLKTTISTSPNQIAVAPGNLVRQWTENNRNYFEYQSDSKIKNSYSFNSGSFDVVKERYKGIDFKIFVHKNHKQNTDNMLQGLKASFDYNTKYFGNYLHNEARIIEFPITKGTYASVMANSIPTSEMRFIANSAPNKVNISFYTQAHELTHYWFGSQLIPADALGAVLLTESITEYISLNIYSESFGKEKALKFLKLQHERYLKGRAKAKNESPLYLVKGEDQYLSYGKGTIAFNTLSHYLGKEKLHKLLKQFIENNKGTYPTSIDLLNHLRQQMSDSLQYLITDYFETITLHETKINSAKVISEEKGQYIVEVDFNFEKFTNNNSEKPKGYIEIGFYDNADKLISIKQVKVNNFENKFNFKLTQKPKKILLDPNWLLIEINKDNNGLVL